MDEFDICLNNNRKYHSEKFPSLCGQSTQALSGLTSIAEQVEANDRTSTVVMLTDMKIDDIKKLDNVKNRLKDDGTELIVGKIIEDAEASKPKINIGRVFIEKDPLELGILIVQELNATGFLCPNDGNYH